MVAQAIFLGPSPENLPARVARSACPISLICRYFKYFLGLYGCGVSD